MGTAAGLAQWFDSELGPLDFGSFSAPRGFPPGTPVFPSPQKPAFLKIHFDPECSNA